MDTRNSAYIAGTQTSAELAYFFLPFGSAAKPKGTRLVKFDLDPSKPFTTLYGGFLTTASYPGILALNFYLAGRLVLKRQLTNGGMSTAYPVTASWLTASSFGAPNAMLVQAALINAYYLMPRCVAQNVDALEIVVETAIGTDAEIYVAVEQSSAPTT